MRGLILAAGRGSRCMPHTDGIPKLFVEVGGKTIWEWQADAIEPHVEELYVVLGYGFEKDGELDREKLEEHVDDTSRAEWLLLPNWDEVDNGETVRWSVEQIHDNIESSAWVPPTKDDVLIMCGDTVISESLVETAVRDFNEYVEPDPPFDGSPYRQNRKSLAVLQEGLQDEETAGRVNDGHLEDYGTMEGHRGTGLWILNDEQWGSVRLMLEENTQYWFSVALAAVDCRAILVDEPIYEINYAEQVEVEEPL